MYFRVHPSLWCSSCVSLALVFCSGCSTSATSLSNLQNEEQARQIIELRIARGSLTENNFEQYSLSGTDLFVECGQNKRGRPTPGAQHFGTLDQEKLSALTRTIDELLELEPSLLKNLPNPGDAKGFTDPGSISLQIASPQGKTHLNTSFDFAAAKTPGVQLKLMQVVRAFRGAAKSNWGLEALCGYENFYGVSSN